MSKKYLIILFFFGIYKLSAQCPSADVSIDLACKNETIILQNNSTNAVSYFWDFCSSDLQETPTIDPNDIGLPVNYGIDIKIIQEGNIFYGFVVSRNNHSLIKLNFGNDLNSTPIISNLGNLGGTLSFPQGIDIIKYEGQWLGIIGYLNNGYTLTYINFGDSIDNTPVAQSITSPSSGRLLNIKIIIENDNLILGYPDFNNSSISRVNYRNSFINIIGPGDIFDTGSLPDLNLPIGIDWVNSCNEWKVIVTSFVNLNNILVYSFGNSVLNDETLIDNYIETSLDAPVRVRHWQEGDTTYVFFMNENSNFILMNFGKLDNSSDPVKITNSEFTILRDIYVYHQNGSKNLIGLSSSNFIQKMTFRSECGQSIQSSNEENPAISYSMDGSPNISLIASNINGEIDGISKQITISPFLAPQYSSTIDGNCLSSPIIFSGQQVSGDITNWNWDFGDGVGTSTLQNDSYAYLKIGRAHV